MVYCRHGASACDLYLHYTTESKVQVSAKRPESSQGGDRVPAAPEESASAPFVRDVQRALRHLYQAAELSRSPLISLLALASEESPAAALRGLLTGAIEALKPAPSVPPQAGDWRVYRTLYHRYVDQFTQRQVAASMALSVRQLRREEMLGVRRLADYLWVHYALAEEGTPPPLAPAADRSSSREQELAWVRRSFPSEPADAAQVIDEALATVEPLVRALGVTVERSLPSDLLRLAAQPDSLRQALLNILAAAGRAVPGGHIKVSAAACPPQVQITVTLQSAEPGGVALGPDGREGLEMARQLLDLSAGALTVAAGGEPLDIRLALPTVERMAVLVIDDNHDTLQLFQRYLAGSPYPFVGVSDPEQAVDLAAAVVPRAIVLDLMLPGVDGWRLLGRLREHPRTRGVPIIVCSILPQEPLALALGAAAFLRKPVTREELLAVLVRQAPLA